MTDATVVVATVAAGTGRGRPASRTATNAGLKVDASSLISPTLPRTGMTGSDTTRNIVSPGVYEGFDFPGAVNISVAGVTIRNCRWLDSADFWAIETYNHANTVIEDCEFSTLVDRCISGNGFTASRLLFHDCGGDAFQLGDGDDTIDTVIEDCAAYDWRPELDAHVDGVHLSENGVHNLTVRRCWFELVDASGYTNPGGDTGYTSPVFCQPGTPGSGSQGTIRVESNYLKSVDGYFAIRFEDGVTSRCIAVNNLLDAQAVGGEQIDASAAFEGALNVLANGVTEYHHPLETTPTDPLPNGGQIPDPTVSGGATASPSAVAGVAAVPAPTLHAGQRAAPSVVSAAAGVPAVTVRAGAGTSPAVVAGTVAIPSPSVRTGSAVTAGVVAATSGLPAPSVRTGSAVTATVVSGVATLPAPTEAAGSTASPAVVGGVAGVPLPSLSTDSDVTVAASAVVGAAGVPAVAVSTGATAGAVSVDAVAGLPAVVVSTGEAATVGADAVLAVAAVPGVAVATGSAAGPGVVVVVAVVPAPAVAGGGGPGPDTVGAVAAVPAPTVTGGATASPATVAVVAAVGGVLVIAGGRRIPRLSGSVRAGSAGLGGSADRRTLVGTARRGRP